MTKKKILVPVLAGAAVVLVLGGVLIGVLLGGDDGKVLDRTLGATTDRPQDVELPDPIELCTVDTEYGQLCYQKQWSGFMQVDQQMRDGILEVSYSALLQDSSYPLFRLTIGAEDADTPFTITDSKGVRRKVSVLVEEDVAHSELSEENQSLLYSMQEDVNIIVDNLR